MLEGVEISKVGETYQKIAEQGDSKFIDKCRQTVKSTRYLILDGDYFDK